MARQALRPGVPACAGKAGVSSQSPENPRGGLRSAIPSRGGNAGFSRQPGHTSLTAQVTATRDANRARSERQLARGNRSGSRDHTVCSGGPARSRFARGPGLVRLKIVGNFPHMSVDLQVLGERIALAAGSPRRGGRSLALLAVRVHPKDRTSKLDEVTVSALERTVSERIMRCLRRSDTIATVGALSYVVLLERLEDGPFATRAADRVVEGIRDPIDVDGARHELVASVGISVFPDDGETLNDLMHCSEEAQKGALLNGGDLFGFYSGPLSVSAGRRLAIERGLNEALEKDEFDLWFQPQIDTRDGRLVGVEALLRWTHPTLGIVSPAEFVPILETTDLVDGVGHWVLEKACRSAVLWAEEGREARVGVNISARQLRDQHFEEHVVEVLSMTGLPPGLLELELTESVLVENPVATRDMLMSLRKRGVRIALDDFGTGYASLAYIRQFPMDSIKIDRQFVRGLPMDQTNAAISSAIVALAQALRLEIVAEGVETEAEEEFLHSLNCFVVQGFRHAKPMNAPDLLAWRRARPWA